MAILQSLLVTGDSRLLNKLYVNEMDVGTNLKVNGTTTSEGALYVGTTTPANAYIYLNNKLALRGNDTYLRINDTVAFANGVYFGTSRVRTDNSLEVGNGSSLAFNATMSAVSINKPTTISSTLNVTGATTLGTAAITTGNITTANINTANIVEGNARNFEVTNTLRALNFSIESVQNLGGHFLVCPTIEVPTDVSQVANPLTFKLTIAKPSTNTFTVTIIDNALKEDTFNGTQWTQKSKIKMTGIISDKELDAGPCEGTITSWNKNTGTVVLTIAVPSKAYNNIAAGNYTSAQVSKVSIMMYELCPNPSSSSTTYPIGIYLTAYGKNRYSYIDVYSGTSNSPSVRMGKVDGLGEVNGTNPTGWGFYAVNNAYFNGMLVTQAGKIGGFSIGETTLKNGTPGTDGSVFITTNYNDTAATIGGSASALNNWRIGAGSKFGVTSDGTLYCTAANITGVVKATSGIIGNDATNKITIGNNATNASLYSGSHSSLASTNAGFYLGADGLSIGAYDSTSGVISCPFQVTSAGSLIARSGRIGKYTITNTYLMTGSGTTATGIGGDQAFWAGHGTPNSAPFRVAYDGSFVSTKGSIGGWTINTNDLSTGTAGSQSGIKFSNSTFTATINGASRQNLMMSIGSKFGVDIDGTLYADGANITNISASNITAGDIATDRLKTNVITAINGNTGTTKIAAGKVEIDGTAIFNSIKTATDAAYDAKGTAADINNRTISRGEQLVTNGNGMIGNNTNFSNWTFDGAVANNSPGSFTRTGGYANIATDDWFPVDASKRYRFEFDMKSQNNAGTMYAFLLFADVDKKEVSASYVMWYGNTLTTLARDLKSGDTVVYLTSVANYTTYGTGSHQRALIFWNYTNSYGYQYPPQTYSRNIKMPAWNDNSSINTTNNTITLASAHSGATIPAGTYVSQGNSGKTYKYSGIVGAKVPTEWTHYTGYFDGIDTSGSNASGKFPPGTAYCKVGFLWNYNSANDKFWVTNIQVYEDYKTDIQTALAYPSMHTLQSSYSQPFNTLRSWSVEGANSGNWAVTSTSGVKVGDTVRIKCIASDMNNTVVYILGTVTQIVSGTTLKMISHGMDNTVIDGGMIWTGTISADRIGTGSIAIGKLDSATQANIKDGNLLLDYADLTTNKWVKEANVTVSYDSSSGMYKVTDTSHSSSRWGIYQDFTVSPNTTYTLSVNLKKGSNIISVSVGSQSGSSWSGSFPTSNTISSIDGNTSRQTVTFTTGASDVIGRIYIHIYPTAANQYGYVALPRLTLGTSVEASNYITYINSTDGIKVHNSGDETNYVQVNSTAISMYRNSKKMMVLDDSALKFFKNNDTTNPVASFGDAIYLYKPGTTTAMVTINTSGATFDGTVNASGGSIGGFKIDGTSIRTNDVAVTSNADNSISLSSADFTRTILSTARSGLRFAIGDKFGITGDGVLYTSGANITNISANNISTGTLSAERIAVTDFTNYCQLNPNTSALYGWTLTQDSSNPNTPWYVRDTLGRDNYPSTWFDCKPGDQFKVSMTVSSTVTGATTSGGAGGTYMAINLGVQCQTATGSSNWPTFTIVTSNAAGTETTKTGYVTIPTSAEYIKFRAFIQIGGVAPFAGTLKIRNPVIKRVGADEYITQIDSNGIWVTPSGKKPTNTSTGAGATGTRINGDGMQIFNAGTQVASYGSAMTIGETGSGKFNTYIDGNGVYMRKATTKFSEFTGSAVKFYDGSGTADANVISQFASGGATIGKTSGNHVVIDTNGITIKSNASTQIANFGSTITLNKYASFTTTALNFYDGSGTAAGNILSQFTSTGATIGKAAKSHIDLNSNGMQVYKEITGGTVKVAEFGENVIIGNQSKSYATISPKSFKMTYDNDYVVFEDLRDDNGLAEVTENITLVDNTATTNNRITSITSLIITEIFECPGSTTTFTLKNPASSIYSVNVETASTPSYTFSNNILTFNTAPAPGTPAVSIRVYISYYNTTVSPSGTGNNIISLAAGTVGSITIKYKTTEKIRSFTFGSIDGFSKYNIGPGYFLLGRKLISSASYEIGTNAIMHGKNIVAQGANSYAGGKGAIALGDSSFASGNNCTASGLCSHAEGSSIYAYGDYSHAQNLYTTANKKAQTVIGSCNIIDNSTTTTHSSGDASYGQYAFIIGNGYYNGSYNRSNALTVDWEGNVEPAGQVRTSFKSSVAMGSYGSSQTTVDGLAEEIRFSSGCTGSVNISTAYTKDNVTVPTGWYNFTYMPHRSGGLNGAASGDNCKYGNLMLYGMTVADRMFRIRINSGTIGQLQDISEFQRFYNATSVSVQITTAGIDTFKDGASLTLPAGTYVLNGTWIFQAGSSTGTRNLECRITNSSDTVINDGRTRVLMGANNYAILQATAIAELAGGTYKIRGSSSMTTGSAGATYLRAVRIK